MLSNQTIHLAAVLLALAFISGCSSGEDSLPVCGSDITDCTNDDDCCPDGCSHLDDSDCPMCNSSIGVTAPLQTCSADHPCTDLLLTYLSLGITVLDEPIHQPVCRTSQTAIGDGRPAYVDSAPGTWTDPDGVTRYHCEFRPDGTAADSKRPLLIHLTGSGGSARSVYDRTGLRGKAENFDLTGDPARPGYILVSSQGRYLHWPTLQPQDGSKHDTYHRDLGVPSNNRDVAYLDQLIDSLAEEGVIDPARIYITGWSNGARFSAMYGIARHEVPTAGGNRIAAVAVYSGGDPFENIQYDFAPSCKQDPYPTSAVPFLLVSRTCDVIACDPAQAQALTDEGRPPTPGNLAETWIDDLRNKVQNPNVEWKRIDYLGREQDQCATSPPCTGEIALSNHLHWPDGIDDQGGNDHEPAMLNFLRAHPLE